MEVKRNKGFTDAIMRTSHIYFGLRLYSNLGQVQRGKWENISGIFSILELVSDCSVGSSKMRKIQSRIPAFCFSTFSAAKVFTTSTTSCNPQIVGHDGYTTFQFVINEMVEFLLLKIINSAIMISKLLERLDS
jgi:hypothetical protein